jgi:hypothetical protein
MFQEVFHQTMSFKFFFHIDFIVKKFLFQFQKSLGRGTHSLAKPKYSQNFKNTLHGHPFFCKIHSCRKRATL